MESKPISGTGAIADSPLGALTQFYKAFNTRDIALMQQNWANTTTISMDNPLGGIMRGWATIRGVYERIFTGQAVVYVEFYDYSLHETADAFWAVGRERGYCQTPKQRIELAIRTSRIFQKIQGTWQQVHHHGSIEDPAHLSTYQNLVS